MTPHSCDPPTDVVTNFHGPFCSIFDEKVTKTPHSPLKTVDEKYISGLQSMSIAASVAMSEKNGFAVPIIKNSSNS